MNALKVHGSGLNKKPVLPKTFNKKKPKRGNPDDVLSVQGWHTLQFLIKHLKK
jgi:hypothetical protein